MNELLGFIVLSGSLIFLVVWIPACAALAIWVGRKVIKIGLLAKVIGGLLVFLFTLFLPIADEIAGRMYLERLCETEASFKVYRSIRLPAEYWNKQGNPKFMNYRGVLDMWMLGSLLEWQNIKTSYVDGYIKIEQVRRLLYDKQSKQVLGEQIDFTRDFGWINRFSPAPNVGESCRNVWIRKGLRNDIFQKERNLILSMFTRQKASK